MSTNLIAKGARVFIGSLNETDPNVEITHIFKSVELAPRKYPTVRLIEGCLMKAAEGDERCQRIWERWEKEADDEMAQRMLEAMSSWVRGRLGG